MQTVEIKTKWNLDGHADTITMAFARALQEEIDKEIIEELMLVTHLNEGWVEPKFKYDNKNADIGAWVHQHAQGEYKNLNGKWIFKNGADATAFTLRWA